MSLKNSYINKTKTPLDISKRKTFIAVFLGVIFSIIFYSFLKVISKVFTLFDAFFHDHELILFPEKSVQTFSFLFAFIAVYFSFSVVFSFLVEMPKKFLSKYNYKRKAILNQQRLSNWFFLSWFSRIAILFGLLALDISSSNFLTGNYFLILLFIIAFTGQIWISIRWFLSKNKINWFFVTVFSSFLLAFLISKIEVLDNDLINQSILSKNILYKHNIKRVSSANYQFLPNHKSLYFNIYLKENNDHLIIETDKGFFTKRTSLKEKIKSYKKHLSEAEYPYISYILHIDKDIKMKHIIKIKKSLSEEEARNIYYSIVSEKHPFYHKSDKAFGFRLNQTKYEAEKGKKINLLKKNKFLFQKDTLSKLNLKKAIKNRIDKEGVSPFVFSFNNNTKFEDYFKILSLSKEIINEYRDKRALKTYGQKYSALSRKNKTFIKKDYYWSFIDIIK